MSKIGDYVIGIQESRGSVDDDVNERIEPVEYAKAL